MKYFIFVTSKDHVNELEKKNVVQAMQEWKMNKLSKGDKIIIYASKKLLKIIHLIKNSHLLERFNQINMLKKL